MEATEYTARRLNYEVLSALQSGAEFVGERRCGKTLTFLSFVGIAFPKLRGHAPIVVSERLQDGHLLREQYRHLFPGQPEPRWMSVRQSLLGMTGRVFFHECIPPDDFTRMLSPGFLPFSGSVRSTLYPKPR
jgi:hypothetical protein